MPSELEVLEDTIRSIWKVIGKEVVMTKECYSSAESGQRVTLLLLTDEEIEQLCQYYAETLRHMHWLFAVCDEYPGGWLSAETAPVYQRLDHFAEIWNKDLVQRALDKAFEGYDSEKERAEYEAQMKEEKRNRKETDRQKREGPPLEEPPWEEPEPMFDGPPF